MSVNAGHGKLRRASKDFVTRWHATKAVWRDENCERFEEKFVTSLMSRLRVVEMAMGHMEAVLNKVRHDCT